MPLIMSSNEIRQLVHAANAVAHNGCAEHHDRNVPYICRRATRLYYWDLIQRRATIAGKSFSGASVLEVGCGTGTFTDLVLSAGAASFRGIDLSPEMIERAKNKTNDARASYEVVSLESFAMLNADKFDIIYSASFLHHLVDLEAGILQLRSMLKQGGVYIAIHEVNTERQLSDVERFDQALQWMFGYAGARYSPFRVRARFVLSRIPLFAQALQTYDWTRRQLLRVSLPSVSNQSEPRTLPERKVDYVDYQLNEPFSLRRKLTGFGEITPYSYLAFTSLFCIARPENHEMFVMVRGN